ncbi:MAG: thioredoxin [bacterium]|jgi:thioredoxin 1|nr:thioredoxin [Phycisphaerales bacterium]MCE2654367.1 thioredoxin [Planctomycetaceae bacterium]
MAGTHTLEFTEANFQSEVLSSAQPVMVDFWAPWCQPCLRLGPTVDKVATAFAGKAKVGKLNVDQAQNLAMKYGIQAIPTILVFKGGQVVKKINGAVQEPELVAALTDASK